MQKMLSTLKSRFLSYLEEDAGEQAPTELPQSKYSSRGPLIFGLIIVVVFFGGLGVWSVFAPLDSAVLANGVVVVESERKQVQHLEGGIVKEILVRDGDVVKKGDILLLLDDTRAKSVLGIINGQLNSALALEARLLAERDDRVEIDFPLELRQSTDVEAQKILEGQTRLFEVRNQSLQGQVEILQQSISQYQEQIEGMKSQQEARESQVALFEKELKGLHKLGSQGHVAENLILERERELARLKGERGKYMSDVAALRQAIGSAQLKVEQLRKAHREEVVMQLRDIQTKIADLRERLVTARDTLDRTHITAPASGVVIGLNVHTPGGVVAPGAKVLEIVPQDDELIFEAQVQPTDIDDVSMGQTAAMRLTSLSFRNTMMLEGEVIHVSADSLTDPFTGQSYYAAKIKIPYEQMARLGDVRLQPGMPAEILIKTGERTVMEYIITPFSNALARSFLEK